MTTTHYRQGYKVIEVDTKTATFKGLTYRDLGSFGRRKFDNHVFLKNSKNEKHYRTKVIYT